MSYHQPNYQRPAPQPYNTTYNQSYNPAGAPAPAQPAYMHPPAPPQPPQPNYQIPQPSYNFAIPYNKPSIPLTRAPAFLYQVRRNPYIEDPPRPPPVIQPAVRNEIAKPPRSLPSSSSSQRYYRKEESSSRSSSSRTKVRERKTNSTMNLRFPIHHVERACIDIRARYPKLFIPTDFTRVIFHWNELTRLPVIQGGGEGRKIVCDSILGRVAKNEEEEEEEEEEAAPVPVASLDRYNVKHNARVMIGYNDGEGEQGSTKKSHLFKDYKFIVGKKDRSSILSLGGSWVKELDGDDPSDDAVLQNTVIRCVRDYCGFDLSSCKPWIKFIEINYHRPSEVIDGEEYPEIFERTVMFYIPDSSFLFPKSIDAYKKEVKIRQNLIAEFEKEVPEEQLPTAMKRMPKQPSLFVYTTKKKIEEGFKTITLSLDGLLDYNYDDRLEKTFEISLFAEGLKEMFQRFHSESIEKFLTLIVGKKRKREDREDNEVEEIEEPPKKRIKVDAKEHPAYHGFKHFDKDQHGYVLVKEFENLLLVTNTGMSQGDARKLVKIASDENNPKRIAYETLEYEKEEEEEEDEIGQDAEVLFKNFQV